MTLLLSVLAAVITTVIWYSSDKFRKMKIGILGYMFWGASAMWFVDAIFEYMELKELYFTPSLHDMVNDAFLGLAVIVLAMVIWVVILLIRDPFGVVKGEFKKH